MKPLWSLWKGLKAHKSQKPKQPELILGFRRMKHASEYCYSPLDGMLVYHRVTLAAVCCRYPWQTQSGVKFLCKETTRRARLEPRTSRSGFRGVKHSATHASTLRSLYIGVIQCFCWVHKVVLTDRSLRGCSLLRLTITEGQLC